MWSKKRNEYKNLSKKSFKDRNKKGSFFNILATEDYYIRV